MDSGKHASPQEESTAAISRSNNPYQPVRSTSAASINPDTLNTDTGSLQRRLSRPHGVSRLRRASLGGQIPGKIEFLDRKEKGDLPAGAPEISAKLGTFSGVFVPTTLNVLSILMFLRFGFVLGQSGVLGMMGMLVASYLINLVTTMSISAIATNGTVRGGGAYYLISRSLGPEFGGSIGIVFYLGCVFNTGMNAVGMVDCLTQNFGSISGTFSNFLFEGFWWQYLWGTIVLIVCTGICLAGSSIFSRASNGLLAILLVATFSIPLSPLFRKPFTSDPLGIEFTGFSLKTLASNLKPMFTKGAAGSQVSGKESFQDLFGILFPATGGIFAGASMSGDLRDPSKSIPKGTLSGLLLTFFTYTVVILAIAATVTRDSLYKDVNIIQDTNVSGALIVLGEFATSFFSALMGLIGAAKLLQAIARDNLIPGISAFGQGTKKNDEPTLSTIFTFVIAQVTMLFDINRIASFITMTYLMTFLVTNLACCLLEVGSAPNFRPSFHYFNAWTALAGTLISGASMFFVDGVYASGCVCILVMLFLLIHYTTPPKSWGDVSQSLIYHQVRKYLLRLRPEHVKFWRPQILLFVDDFDSQYKIIHFCNSLKKGALFVLGRVIVTRDFAETVPEARKEQTAWNRFVEFSKVKAFVNIAISPSAEWGIRNIVLNSGLGGMRPNIVVIDQFRGNKQLKRNVCVGSPKLGAKGKVSHPMIGTETSGQRDSMSIQGHLTVLEDLLFKLRINVAVARGFEELELPSPRGHNTKRYIDLWPIQMSAQISGGGSLSSQNILTTNFDTYTLILQLGCILHTVRSWKSSYRLRVAVFVEYETDVEEERGRVEALLEKLRIEAEVLVFWLASGALQTYRVIVNGEQSGIDEGVVDHVDSVLKDEDWWREVQRFRKGTKGKSGQGKQPGWPESPPPGQRRTARLDGIRKLLESSRRKSVTSIGGVPVSLGIQTHRLLDSMVDYSSESTEETASSEESDIEAYVSDADAEDEGEDTDDARAPRATKPPQRSGMFRRLRPRLFSKQRSDSVDESAISEDSDESPAEIRPPRHTLAPTAPTAKDVSQALLSSRDKPSMKRNVSTGRFSSSPIPETKVATEETTGPSIMFATTSPPRSGAPGTSGLRESIYTRATSADRVPSSLSSQGSGPRASGYPSQASVPLSFNDLPCRAQHLILNELIKTQSEKTAVVFTTLPSPAEGTYRDLEASESYVSDLEVFCDGLPPCLLVHSNSMTVTMNL